MGLQAEHMRASYDTYINHGNSSSATVISVLDRLRQKDMDSPHFCPGGRAPRDHVVTAAFGPGICVEMAVLKRNLKWVGRGDDGLVTPPDSERGNGSGEASGNEEDGSLSDALNGVELD